MSHISVGRAALFIIVTIIFLHRATAATSMPITSEAAKVAIQALYDKSNAAGRKSDINGMLAFCTPDFKLKQIDGDTQDLADLRMGFGICFNFSKYLIDSRTRIIHVTWTGNAALVETAEDQRMTFMLPPEHITDVSSYICRDRWILTSAGWRETSSIVVSTTTIENGKPAEPNEDHW